MNKMKILYLSPGVFDKGGISRYNRYQISALREICGESNVKVLSLYGPDKESFEEEFKVTWHGTGFNTRSKILYLLKVMLNIILWKPSLVFVGHVNFSGFSKTLAKVVGSKVVLNVYGLEVWSGLSLFADWGLRNADYVISDCHFTAKYIEEEKYRKKESTKVIWDCVDLEKFKPLEKPDEIFLCKYGLPPTGEHFIILTLGRIAKEASHKGYHRLLEVFKKVVEVVPHARLIFAGKGSMVEELKSIAIANDLEENVVFTGMVHEDDMAKLYSYADVFSLVSDRGKGRGEGIPLTPLEAMACGTPIIVGNQDGSQEAVFDQQNGYVIDPFDLESHAAILITLSGNKKELLRLSKGAVHIANSAFSYQIFKKKHVDFLEKINISF